MDHQETIRVFSTKDAALAVTLATAGIPWADPNRRCTNTYPDKVLLKAGKTAEEMIRAGLPGEVMYAFQHVPELERILDDFAVVFKDQEGALTEIPELTKRQIALIAMTALKNRRTFSEDWKKHTPHVRIDRGGGNFAVITKNTPKAFLDVTGITGER